MRSKYRATHFLLAVPPETLQFETLQICYLSVLSYRYMCVLRRRCAVLWLLTLASSQALLRFTRLYSLTFIPVPTRREIFVFRQVTQDTSFADVAQSHCKQQCDNVRPPSDFVEKENRTLAFVLYVTLLEIYTVLGTLLTFIVNSIISHLCPMR